MQLSVTHIFDRNLTDNLPMLAKRLMNQLVAVKDNTFFDNRTVLSSTKSSLYRFNLCETICQRNREIKGVHPGGGMHPPQYFLRGDDNAFITPNIERNCYAIAVKHSNVR